jgi:small subunit ribosomal protein S1
MDDNNSLDGMIYSAPTSSRLEVGQVVQGTVEMISSGYVFLNVGAKSEAMLDVKEVTTDDGELTVSVGDTMEAYVVAVEPELVLSHAMAREHLNLQGLQDARDLGIPVEGTVTGLNKGGLEVDLGGARAFCPISQIEAGYCEDASGYVGQTLQFRVTEFAEEGRNIVVSRRALLEEEQQEAASEIQAQLQEGAEFEGQVVSLQPYGAFVDIGGGIQGMVHISEISHARVEHPSEVLQEKQTVRVKVLRIEPDPKHPDRQRIGLSIRALQGDPWDESTARLEEGGTVEGQVVRLQNFGAFVQIAPGVDGLIHVSELSDRRIRHPEDVVSVGQKVQATVLKLDHAAKRISLSLRAGGGQAREELVVGAVVEVVVSGIKPFGLFVNIKGYGRDARGLVPAEDTGAGRNANLRRAFPEGSEHRAMITAVEPDTGKLRLSFTAVSEQEERKDFDRFKGGGAGESSGASAPQGLGTLGDMLQQALNKDDKGK